jgi:hypothetical protein
MKTVKNSSTVSKANKAAARTAKEQAKLAAHEAKSVAKQTKFEAEKAAMLAPTAKPEVAAKPAAKVKAPDAGRDALGGRLGTFASTVNILLIEAGKSGLTLREAVVASKSETPQPVNSQLKNLVARKLATRAENTEGKFCYVASF